MIKKDKMKRGKKKKSELGGTRVKLTFKKHFLPPLAGLFVAVLVFGFFNSQLISGRVAYKLHAQDISKTASKDASTNNSAIDKNAPPRIVINKINVSAPVIFDQNTVNEKSFQKALQHGVVHYPNTAQPGQIGNVVVFGHSSGQWWAPGDYKFVFTLLDKLTTEDRIFLEYQGVRYTYRVYNSSVVAPTDLSVLNQGSSHMLTLITCTPVGTSSKRLIIRAAQIDPKVASNTASNQAAQLPSDAGKKLPSNSSSFWQDLKELF